MQLESVISKLEDELESVISQLQNEHDATRQWTPPPIATGMLRRHSRSRSPQSRSPRHYGAEDHYHQCGRGQSPWRFQIRRQPMALKPPPVPLVDLPTWLPSISRTDCESLHFHSSFPAPNPSNPPSWTELNQCTTTPQREFELVGLTPKAKAKSHKTAVVYRDTNTSSAYPLSSMQTDKRIPIGIVTVKSKSDGLKKNKQAKRVQTHPIGCVPVKFKESRNQKTQRKPTRQSQSGVSWCSNRRQAYDQFQESCEDDELRALVDRQFSDASKNIKPINGI